MMRPLISPFLTYSLTVRGWSRNTSAASRSVRKHSPVELADCCFSVAELPVFVIEMCSGIRDHRRGVVQAHFGAIFKRYGDVVFNQQQFARSGLTPHPLPKERQQMAASFSPLVLSQ